MVTMLPPSLVIAAGAVLTWPGQTPTRRLHDLFGRRRRAFRRSRTWRRALPAMAGVAVLGALLVFGLGVAVALAVAGLTGRSLWLVHQRQRNQLSSAEAMTDAVQAMVAELRSGAHPVVAAESAAKDAREPARSVLTSVAATARLGGDPAPALDRSALEHSELAPVLRPLGHAWALAQRHGLPLADVLDAVCRDVTGRVRFAHRVHARMAGPRASGTVLAVLPLLGVLLGTGMGADPLRVLFTGSLGQFLLAVGTSLICVGLYWINRLTSRAVLS